VLREMGQQETEGQKTARVAYGYSALGYNNLNGKYLTDPKPFKEN
jgi:hypothetical protein